MSEAKLAILVVEDEESIRRGVCDVLAYHGFAPEGVERGDDGLRRALANQHALAILDVMLPGRNGFEICRELRAGLPSLPILMLTARGAEPDVLEGFRSGADDYVTKPFSVAELVARVEALLRRSGAHRAAPVAVFAFGSWQIDPAERLARRGDDEVALTPRELGLLALFAAEPGRILGRRRLLREVWGFGEPERIETRTVDMHIAKLRRKLGDAAAGIETVRGEGYRFSG
ncbi:MAG TPA: response regulator transcription factor [Myxococcota bacterium]|nr:response regulator transcription factor [Myxococcota bacterium]